MPSPGLTPLQEEAASKAGPDQKSARTLETRPRLAVYIDAGHSVWKPVAHDARSASSKPASPRPTASPSTSRTTTARPTGRLRHAVCKAHQGQALRHRHQPQRPGPRAGREWCNPPGRASGTPRPPTYRASSSTPCSGSRPRRVRRHLQRRPARGRVVAGLRARLDRAQRLTRWRVTGLWDQLVATVLPEPPVRWESQEGAAQGKRSARAAEHPARPPAATNSRNSRYSSRWPSARPITSLRFACVEIPSNPKPIRIESGVVIAAPTGKPARRCASQLFAFGRCPPAGR